MTKYSFVLAITLAFVGVTTSTAGTIGADGDGAASVVFDFATGEVLIDTDGQTTAVVQILSESGIFTGDEAQFPAGAAIPSDLDGEIAFTLFGPGFADDFDEATGEGGLSFGNVAVPGLTESFLESDLTITFSEFVGAPLIEGDFFVVNAAPEIPEPASLALVSLGLVGVAARRRRV